MGSGKKWVLVRCRDLCLSLKFGLWLRCSKISRILSRLDLFPISGNWTRILCGSEGWPFLSFGTLLEHLNTSLVMFIIMLQWLSKRSQKSFETNVEAIWACREYAGAGGCQLLCYLCGTYDTAQWQYNEDIEIFLEVSSGSPAIVLFHTDNFWWVVLDLKRAVDHKIDI